MVPINREQRWEHAVSKAESESTSPSLVEPAEAWLRALMELCLSRCDRAACGFEPTIALFFAPLCGACRSLADGIMRSNPDSQE